MRLIVPALLGGLSASAVDAATDTTTIACAFVTTCDQDGNCTAAVDQRVIFKLEPVKVEHHGDGEYIISYDEIAEEMRLDIYPTRMTWTEGDSDIQTLTGLGRTGMIWHQFEYSGEDATSVVHFLKCEDEA
jgi:hypothetical protein